MDEAIKYLGGSLGVDVLTRSVEVTDMDGHCVLSDTSQEPSISFSDALELDSGISLRECLDGRSSQFVACSEEHTGEVVARVEADSAESLDCESRARAYMGQDLSKRYEELTVDEVTTDSARRCVVSLRADNRWMETSLRGLGSGAIETSAIV